MKKILIFLLTLFILPGVMSLDLTIEKLSSDETTLVGTNQPIILNLSVKNNDYPKEIEFYANGFLSFINFNTGQIPDTSYYFEKGETKNISLNIYQMPTSDITGKVTFEYFIKSGSEKLQQRILVNLATLPNSLKINQININPETEQFNLILDNKVNYEFKDLSLKFSSPFFNKEEIVSLKPYEKKEIKIILNKTEFENLKSGFYTLSTKAKYGNITANIESKIDFQKKELLDTKTTNSGFFVFKTKIEESNTGNTLVSSESVIKRNIFTRLFTTQSVNPTNVERDGAAVYYTWANTLNPGESFKVVVSTNWFIPILIVILVVAIVYYTRKYVTQKVVVRKKISYVRTKGGEFALKVTLIAEAREFVEDVRIIDLLPPIVKIYERFGGEFPDKISKDKRRLEWHYSYLDSGEKRIMNYVIYSKVGILGKFALPSAICRYKKEGKLKESNSNKTFFLSEQQGNKNKKFNF